MNYINKADNMDQFQTLRQMKKNLLADINANFISHVECKKRYGINPDLLKNKAAEGLIETRIHGKKLFYSKIDIAKVILGSDTIKLSI